MELDFDKIFKISTAALKINRTHPYIKRDKKWILQFLIVYGYFTSVFLLVMHNIIFYNLRLNDFPQTCKNLVLCVVYTVVSFQYWVLSSHRKTLVGLINNINMDYERSKTLSPDERGVVEKYANQGLWVCKQWLVLSAGGASMFFVKNLVLMVYYYNINEFRLIPFYDLIYPSVIEENKDNLFVYLFTYVLMLGYDCYGAMMYVAYVPLGPIFMLHACGQLELVKKRIEDLFVDCDDQVIMEKLRIILEHLQYIHSFVDRIKECFEIAYELTMKASTIMLPITCYEVLEALKNGEVSLEFIAFIIGGALISSSPCFYSDLLMEKGEDVRLALYTCGWELHYNHRTRTTLQLMLQQALKPIAIQTVFRTLCLEALTDLFQESYAIFNLMNAMWS